MAELKIKADSGGGTVSFKGPATTTSNAAVQLTLPVDDGTANQYLKTDGSGALSWATPTDNGKVLQIKFTNVACANSNEQDITSTSYTAITNPTLAITPATSGNKILVQAMLPYNVDNDDNGEENTLRVQLLRTQSCIADVVVGTAQYASTGEHSPGGWLSLSGNIVMNIVDTTVNASAITYKFQAKLAHSADSVRFHLGDSHTGTGSSIIATEFA